MQISFIPRRRPPFRSDLLAGGLALLCAVHCAAMPVLLGATALSGTHWAENPWLEGGLLGFTGVVGGGTLVAGAVQHRRWELIALFGAGLAVVFAAHELPAPWNILGSLVGAGALLFAQRQNRRHAGACCCAVDSTD